VSASVQPAGAEAFEQLHKMGVSSWQGCEQFKTLINNTFLQKFRD
jgi:hypothetical protein